MVRAGTAYRHLFHVAGTALEMFESFNGPFVYGGTNCTRAWNFVDIFFFG